MFFNVTSDRESPQWNFDKELLDRRRTVFWDTFLMESSIVSSDFVVCFIILSNRQSLLLGRPPSIRGSYIDCPFPEDTEETTDENGVKHPGGKLK